MVCSVVNLSSSPRYTYTENRPLPSRHQVEMESDKVGRNHVPKKYDPAIFNPATDTAEGKSFMKTTHKIIVWLAGAVLLVTLLAAVSFWTFRQVTEAAEMRRHTQVVLISADEFLSALKDAETGQRGYLLTGDETFLKPYLAVRDSISGQLQKLRQLALHLAASPRYAASLTPPDIDLLYKSAPLHDIGKTGIADHILLKPGKLTPEEFEEMKKHSIIGWRALNRTAQLLGSNSFLHYACEIALTHHEKWDGSGYPHGLCGEAIPLSGRLMAVSDVYDALISHRPYKNPFPHAEAAALIIEGRGHHFDPAIIDAFIALESEFQQISKMVTDVPADAIELTPEIAGVSTPLRRPFPYRTGH